MRPSYCHKVESQPAQLPVCRGTLNRMDHFCRCYPSLGKFGVGYENSNGYRLLQFLRYNNLVITNAVFGRKTDHKLTWYSRDSKTANIISYVIVN